MTLQKPEEFETGLEDFDNEDMAIPRLNIEHKKGTFRDTLTNEEHEKVKVIFLGLQKQRTLWHFTVDEGDYPMCRSVNHETGVPNLSEKQPKEKRFPWEKSGFSPDDFPPDENGVIKLPCSGCQLKEWESHPDGKKPYCAEQFTMPVLYDPDDSGMWVPAIMTFQKTSMKPIKSYLTQFKRNKTGAFSAITEITLTPQKKGSNEYCVPNFRRVGDTDQEDWREYMTTFRTIRDFLTEDPGSNDAQEEVPSSSGNPEAKSQDVAEAKKDEDIIDVEPVEEEVPEPTPEPEVKKEEPAPSASSTEDDDDDLPF